MTLNGLTYPNYPEDINAYEMGWMDYERSNGQNPWSRGTVEALGWRKRLHPRLPDLRSETLITNARAPTGDKK